MTRWLLVLVAAAVGATTVAVTSGADAPPPAGVVSFPADFPLPIEVGGKRVYTPEVESSTTTSPATTTTAETTTTSTPPTTETTSASGSTSTTPSTDAPEPTAPSTTSAPPTGGTGCGSSGAVFCEDFSDADPNAWKKSFDHGWSGELHAGALFGADRNGWPMDHDMQCGNPNTTSHQVFLGGGWDAQGATSPAAADPAFMACLPTNDPDKGHLMTSANTEGYVIAWFSPKPVFTNVRRVCFDINLTYQGNGQWFQLVFLTAEEAARAVNVNGQTVRGDLGFTSPDFPGNNGQPSTHQGLAGAGIKFQVEERFGYHAWNNGAWTTPVGFDVGPSTSDKAPRYPICVTDNENGTLRMVTKSTNGTTVTRDIPGAIPNGPVRVVLEHDEYNPDKHHSNAGPVDHNAGEGYTYHWDNVQVWEG